jgi:hypothetical protein
MPRLSRQVHPSRLSFGSSRNIPGRLACIGRIERWRIFNWALFERTYKCRPFTHSLPTAQWLQIKPIDLCDFLIQLFSKLNIPGFFLLPVSSSDFLPLFFFWKKSMLNCKHEVSLILRFMQHSKYTVHFIGCIFHWTMTINSCKFHL